MNGLNFAWDGDHVMTAKLEAAMQAIDGLKPKMQRVNGIELADTPDGSLRHRLAALDERLHAIDGMPGPAWDRLSDRYVILALSERIDALPARRRRKA
jgi:hypothetical protein